MRNNWTNILTAVGTASILAVSSSVFAKDIDISGTVHATDGQPIFMIQVGVYRDSRELDHVFTDNDGKYKTSAPSGSPITIRFDTHETLNNAADWHPSVVANIDATKDISLDRILARVGTSTDAETSIDALNGYEFGAFWEDRQPNKEYAESALRRLSMIKVPTIVQDWAHSLKDHFQKRKTQ